MESLLKKLYGWHGPVLIDQGFASHVGWAIALPLIGHWLGGRKLCALFGLLWIAYSVYCELWEETLEATTLSDLISRIVPALFIVVLSFWR